MNLTPLLVCVGLFFSFGSSACIGPIQEQITICANCSYIFPIGFTVDLFNNQFNYSIRGTFQSVHDDTYQVGAYNDGCYYPEETCDDPKWHSYLKYAKWSGNFVYQTFFDATPLFAFGNMSPYVSCENTSGNCEIQATEVYICEVTGYPPG